MIANSLAFVDRQILAFLIEPIQRDFNVSDTGMSLIYGFSFTLFYVAAGIPLAWLADRSNRRNIAAGSILFWSLATSACGLASSYVGLFVARIGVGAGESGLGPASYSLLSDYFPREKLATALGLYQAGIYVGGAIALIFGGLFAATIAPGDHMNLPLIGPTAGWQLIFLLLGIPGILLSLIVWLAVREPLRKTPPPQIRAPIQGQEDINAGAPAKGESFYDAFRQLNAHRRFYLGLIGGFTLLIFVGSGTAAWIPAFLAREYGMSLADIGRYYGIIMLICGLSGCLVGGMLASAMRKGQLRHGNLVAPLIGSSCLIPCTIAFPLMPTASLALAVIGAMNFFGGFNLGGGLASLLEMTPPRLRAQISMTYVIAVNVLGGTLGPLAIALMTDYVFQDPADLGQAIAIICAIASPLAVIAIVSALRPMKTQLAGMAAAT
ncbi:spinster family MFS transporter [Altericroceibacterium endophyticum]|nr:MFS transporter [Altericroceibacterium endophyticum]